MPDVPSLLSPRQVFSKENEWSKLVALLSNLANYTDIKSLKCADSSNIFTYMVLIQEKLCNKVNECIK